MSSPRTFSIVAAATSAATIVAAAIYWSSDASESLAVGADVLTKAIGAFWILGIGFTIASVIAIVALRRGEPRNIPMTVIALESLIFVGFIVGIALS